MGNKPVKILLCGELLCGQRCFAEILTITPLGIPLISSVGDFDDELRLGLITIAGDIESVEDRSPAWGKKELRWG